MKLQVRENTEVLQRGVKLLRRINDAVYQQRVSAVFASSIGAHVRHNLDHYASLLDGLGTGSIDYEVRKRDTVVEIDRHAAVAEIERVCRRLEALSEVSSSLRVRVRSDKDLSSSWATTSLSRELDFLLSHTIHHYAIVATLCRLLGVWVEDDFGVAPSTLRYWASLGVAVTARRLPQPHRERQ